MILITFLVFLALFFLIGISSVFFSRKTSSDYLVAGKNLHPALIGLSAVATNNSGFMFIGMIGATYVMGLSSIWLMIGWILGDFLIQRTTTHKIREAGHKDPVHSFGGLIYHWILSSSPSSSPLTTHRLRQLIGVLTLLFLTVYAAAQLKAGTKATEELLDWPTHWGIIVAAVLIFSYSLAGGLRASIWTDVAQSIVMLIGMITMVWFGWQAAAEMGGFGTQLHAVSPTYMNWFPADSTALSAVLFVIGWFFGGAGVIGQPHIVIRFISLSPNHSVRHMQAYYYGWFTFFYGLTILAGLLSRVLIPDIDQFDAELALPMLAEQLMPQVFVGLILAALFAATISTVDSLILACSAALSRDFKEQPTQSLRMTKLATFTVLSLAVALALSNQQSVFDLVLDAWGMLGSAFAPLILWLALGRHTTPAHAITAILGGLVTFLIFAYGGIWTEVYTLTFGFMAGLMILALPIFRK